jgi:PAS domain S-box-containing protein
MAAELSEQVIAADVATDPRWAASPWPSLVLGHGLRSCWSTPIRSRDGGVIGVFALYKTEPSRPNPLEQDLIRQFTHIASIAIERSQSDTSLKQSEARKAAILDSALDAIVTMDHLGRITEFSPAAERTFGYLEAEVLGRPLADTLIPPPQRERHRLGLTRYLATGETSVLGKRIEMTAMRADGAELPVELTVTRIDLDGPPSFTGYLRDISDRRRSEEELRRTNGHLAEAQRLSLTGSFTWNVTADEHYWSDEVYRMFGFDASERVTLPLILRRVHPEDMPLVDEVVARASAGLDVELEFRAIMPTGSVKHFHVVAHRVQDLPDRMEFLGAVRDVTERKLSEEALGKVRSELAQMARVTTLGALTASIAHEVNQPLSGIITNASTCLKMLAADPPNVAGARETARRTVRDGNRAADVIKRLRSLFANKDVTNDVVDLNEAAREVIALSWSDLQRSRVIVRSELASDLPPVTGDRVQLQQVILNLLLNAADAMSQIDDRPRQVLIGTDLEDAGEVRLTVTDAGVGLGPEAAERLFEAFYTTKREGMGIGLSISRSIVESHGGRLWAEANDDGPGATFAFALPCSPSSGAAGWRPGPADTAPDMRVG